MDREFLDDIYLLLQNIQAGRGTHGLIKNVYLPRLTLNKLDDMTEKVRRLLTANPQSISSLLMPVCQHGFTGKCKECAADKAWG